MDFFYSNLGKGIRMCFCLNEYLITNSMDFTQKFFYVIILFVKILLTVKLEVYIFVIRNVVTII
jgi:hypothetical protein